MLVEGQHCKIMLGIILQYIVHDFCTTTVGLARRYLSAVSFQIICACNIYVFFPDTYDDIMLFHAVLDRLFSKY